MSTALLAARSERTARRLRVPVALLLALGAVGAYQLGVRQGAPPTFREGGAFLGRAGAAPLSAAGTVASPPDARGATTPAGTPSPARAGTGGTPSGSVGAGAGSVPAAGTAPVRPAPAGAAPGGQPGPALPALGTYTYGLSGTESATGFGSRSLPSTMDVVVHRTSGLPADEVVLDIHISDQHNEREILEYRRDAVAMVFEAGAVTFGPMTQTSQADYSPAIAQTPLPASSGATLAGTSRATASDGSVSRVEDWTSTVTGAEAVGQPGGAVICPVVQVQRRSRPGYAEQENRSVTYWYDPARHLWARWHVVMHGQRAYVGFTFTYDESLTATLEAFQPS